MSDLRTRYKNLDMAIAYNEVTEKYGPCIQLMEFMNFDKKLGEEIGLESFDSLSLLGQHEMLVATMNISEMEEMAIESVDTAIDSFSKFLKGAGLVGAMVSTTLLNTMTDTRSDLAMTVRKRLLIGTAISAAAALAGHLISKFNVKYHKHPIAYMHFNSLKNSFEDTLDHEFSIASKIPNSFDLTKWEQFAEYVEKISHEEDEDDDHGSSASFILLEMTKSNSKVTVPFEKSGWTAANFAEAVKWIDTETKRLESLRDKYSALVEKISKYVKANQKSGDPHARGVIRQIGLSVEDIHSLFSHSGSILGKISGVLNTVAHYFEEKK